MSKKILVTGASGLVGSRLSAMLSEKYSVIHLGRTKKNGTISSFVWNIRTNEIDPRAIAGVDTIVHLAGAGVSEKRWTNSWKKEILDSRIQTTRLLFEALKNNTHQVKSFVSASAIGYYGFEGDAVFDEESKPGKDFLAQVTKQWEEEVDKITSLGIRVVKIRIGIVLSKTGGALEKMALPIRYGVGSSLGSGDQYLSWIHIDDLCGIILKAIEDQSLNGAYNAVAGWATNRDMTRAIAKAMHRPLWAPHIPAFALKIAVGEMAQVVLNGSRVSPEKIKQTGYQFKFGSLEEALANLLD